MIVPGYPDLLPLHGMVLGRLHSMENGAGGHALVIPDNDQPMAVAAADLVTAGLIQRDGDIVTLTDNGRAIFNPPPA
jgi:hypothetical protein